MFLVQGLLEDGREVAVKRLGRSSRQGAREFQNEAMLLSTVQHRNVVTLHGYCAHADEQLLVYEYVPNESLDKLLFSSKHPPTSSSSSAPSSSSLFYFIVRLILQLKLLFISEKEQKIKIGFFFFCKARCFTLSDLGPHT